MIRRYVPILLAMLLLANTVVIVLTWFQLNYWSLQEFRSPVRAIPLEAQLPAEPQTRGIVMVIVSGLGYDSSETLELPTLAQLRQAGASMIIQSEAPTFNQTAWGTLITGAKAELNDAPPYDKTNAELYPLAVDTLFQRAKTKGYRTAMFGLQSWQYLIPPEQLTFAYFADETTAEADEAIVEAALPIIESKQFELVVIQLGQLEAVARERNGPSSEAYQTAATRIDTYLNEIQLAMDFSQTILVVLSDHGHLDTGGQGGAEPEITRQPLVLVGDTIVPGNYSEVLQQDIAPTMTALLGLAPPTVSQGRVLYEVVRLNDFTKAMVQLQLAQQRVKLAEAYRSVLAGEYLPPSETVQEDVTRAQKIFAEQNINGTFELASLIQKQADMDIALTRQTAAGQAQQIRLLVLMVILGIWVWLMWRFRGSYTSIIIVAAVITFVAYHVLYQLQGYTYSISTFINLAELPWEITRRLIVSLLLGSMILLTALLLSGESNPLRLLSLGYGFTSGITFIFTLPLFWAFWQSGIRLTFFLPAPDVAFWQLTSMMSVLVVALLGLIIPWPMMVLTMFISLIRQRLTQTDQQSEADRLTGLRL